MASCEVAWRCLQSETRLFISLTTHSISASVVLKLVIHARMTGTPFKLGLRHPGDLTFAEGRKQDRWNKTFAGKTNQQEAACNLRCASRWRTRLAQHLSHVRLVLNHRGVARLAVLALMP